MERSSARSQPGSRRLDPELPAELLAGALLVLHTAVAAVPELPPDPAQVLDLEADNVFPRTPPAKGITEMSIAELRASIPKDKFQKFLDVYDRTSAVRYVPHSTVPLLFQFARYERFFNRAAIYERLGKRRAAIAEYRLVRWRASSIRNP